MRRGPDFSFQTNSSMLWLGMLLIFCMLAFQYLLVQVMYGEIEDKLTEVTRQSAAIVEERIDAAYEQLTIAGSLMRQPGINHSEAMAKLRQEDTCLAQYRYVGAVSVQGELLYGDALPEGAMPLLQEAFRGHQRASWQPGGRLLPGKSAILLSIPLWDHGKVAGAVYGVLEGPAMQGIFAGTTFNEKGSLFAASRDFELIWPYGTENEIQEAAADFFFGSSDPLLQELYRKLYYSGHGVETFTHKGHEYYLSSVTLDAMDGWYINSVVAADKVNGVLKKVLLVAVAAYMLLSLLFLAAFWVIGRNARQNQQQLMKLAYHDSLTGVPNWAGMQQQWQLRSTGKLWLMAVVDFDEFSMMNSVMGRDYCDQVLLSTVELLKTQLRSGELVGRVGADRFLLYLQQDQESLSRLEDLLAAIRKKETRYPVEVSCGVRLLASQQPMREIYEEAVMALKHAKSTASCHLAVYDYAMGIEHKEMKSLEQDFAKALECRELQLFLQPKHFLSKSGWAGSEALVRWKHPRLGLLQPGRFIHFLEASGAIYQLDLYILEETCRTMRRWLDEKRQIRPVSVNVSRVNFASCTLVEDILAIIDKWEIPHELLEIEVTESAFFSDSKVLLDKLQQMHDAGLRLAIDDFGTGYSTLATLEELPVDVLKLDKGFVDCWHERAGSSLVGDIVTMARHIGISVVIEGVENAGQAELTRAAGCDIAQGYYYARPLPVSEYEALVYGGEQE